MRKRVELASARLCLRSLRVEDADAIVAYRALPNVARFQSWDTYTLEDARRLIDDQTTLIPSISGT